MFKIKAMGKNGRLLERPYTPSFRSLVSGNGLKSDERCFEIVVRDYKDRRDGFYPMSTHLCRDVVEDSPEENAVFVSRGTLDIERRENQLELRRLFFERKTAKRFVGFGVGTGIVPVLQMAFDLKMNLTKSSINDPSAKFTVVVVAFLRDEADVEAYAPDVEALRSLSGVEIMYVLSTSNDPKSRSNTLAKGLDAVWSSEDDDSASTDVVSYCGPWKFNKALKLECLRRGVVEMYEM